MFSICSISDKKIFVYGGYSNNYETHEDGYIIDIYKCSAQKIKNGYANCINGVVLKNKFLYIFGYYPDGNDLLNISQSYNLVTNEWNMLGNLTVASYRTTTSLKNNVIHITGFFVF